MKTIHIFAIVAMALFGLNPTAVADDEADFSTPPPVSWLRNDPLGMGTYDYTGGRLRLSTPAPPPEVAAVAGPGRVQLFAPTIYGQCAVSVDVVGWSTTRTFAAVGLRLTNPGPGTTAGYAFALVPSINVVEIHRLDGEVPTMISISAPVPVVSGNSYRMVFTAVDGYLTGRVFDLADLSTPIVEVSAFDTTYIGGVTALSVSTDALVPIEVTFDNFLAWDGTPPPLSITPGAGMVVLSANGPRSLAAKIETTDDLSAAWFLAFPASSTVGSEMVRHFPMDAGPRFYRMKLLGSP